MDEVLSEFLVESYENLDRLDRDLVDLERDPSPDKLAAIFRTIHTIKGTSGFLAFNKLESITHVGENLLSRLRDGELTVDGAITSGLLALVDGIRQILTAVEASGAEGDGDYTALVAELTRPTSAEPAAATEPAPFAELAVEAGFTTESAIELALKAQETGDPRRIGEILIDAGEIEPAEVAETLRAQVE